MPESLPPAHSTTTEEVLKTVLPLVIKAASDSASSAIESASAISQLQRTLTANTDAILKMEAAVTKMNDLHAEEVKERGEALLRDNEDRKQKWETIRSIFTPQFIIQLLTILATGAGLYSQLPDGETETRPPAEYHGPAPAPSFGNDPTPAP